MYFIKNIIKKILDFLDNMLFYNSDINSYKNKNNFQIKKMY